MMLMLHNKLYTNYILKNFKSTNICYTLYFVYTIQFIVDNKSIVILPFEVVSLSVSSRNTYNKVIVIVTLCAIYVPR